MFFYAGSIFLYVLLGQKQRRACELELSWAGVGMRSSKESKVSGKSVSGEQIESLTWGRKRGQEGLDRTGKKWRELRKVRRV